MRIAVYLLVYVFEALIAYMYYNDNFKIKRKHFITIAIAEGLYLLCFLGNEIGSNSNIVNIITFIAANIILSLICFEISVKSAVLHSLILCAIMFATELIVEAGMTWFNLPIDAYKDSLIILIVVAVLCKALYLLVCKILSALFSYKESRYAVKNNFILLIYPLIIIALNWILLCASTMYEFERWLNLSVGIVSTLSLLFCCFIFIYNRFIQNQQVELFELQQQSFKNETDMQYLNLLEQKSQEMQIMAHDYKNHLAALRQMESKQQADEYIDRIADELSAYSGLANSGNRTLDVILSKYVAQCQLNGIDFQYNTKLSNLGFVDDYDLVGILGNLLDNALEAAEKSVKKKISFTTNRVNTYDSITVTNSCDTAPDSELVTTKKNKQLHGFGMKSIRKSIKKYDGELEWNYDDTAKQFSITVILLRK